MYLRSAYYNRGIGYLAGTEKEFPAEKLHYTATPNYFGDKDEKWFAQLSKEQVEALAGVPGFGIYAYDFEFWNQHYPKEVIQRLIWFSNVVRKNHPNMHLMDYWGGGAYTNPHINTVGGANPKNFSKIIANLRPTTMNLTRYPTEKASEIYSIPRRLTSTQSQCSLPT